LRNRLFQKLFVGSAVSLPRIPDLRRRDVESNRPHFFIKKSNQCPGAASKVKVAAGLADLGNDSAKLVVMPFAGISPRDCIIARSWRDIAVAGLAQFARARRVPGCGALGRHPVAVESVAWISEMKNTQSGLFYLFIDPFLREGRSISGQWLSYFVLPVIVMLSIFWLERARWSRAFFFAFAYFVVALLPTLGFIDEYPFRFSFVFDHFQYLASIGPLALAGTALARFANFIIPKKPWLQSSLCAGLLLILGMARIERGYYAVSGSLTIET
jgi:hypothetical protein